MIFNHPFHFPFEGSVIVSLVPSLTCGAANEDNKDFNLHSRNRLTHTSRSVTNTARVHKTQCVEKYTEFIIKLKAYCACRLLNSSWV